MSKPQSALAFDFGTKSIGIAAGQALTASASELKPIPAKEGIPNWQTLEQLISEWKPDIAIVGLPLNMDGSEGEITRRARKFGNRLHGRFGIAITFFDERLSTREAKSEAAQRGHQGNYGQAPIDSIAARLILESYWRELSAR